MDESRGLRDKLVMITGDCGDIGSATARKLSALGARPVLFDILDDGILDDGPAIARELAEQIADAFVFLCSRESNDITGQVLVVDGGCSLSKPQ